VLFQLSFVLFQLSVDAPMAFDSVAHAPDDDYDGKCNQYKKHGNKYFRYIFNIERVDERQYEERRRRGAEREAKKACAKPTDKRCDYDSRKEREVVNARDIRIDREPYCRGNRGTRESKAVGPNGSRPQDGNINVH
jgi:hypothetical protein